MDDSAVILERQAPVEPTGDGDDPEGPRHVGLARLVEAPCDDGAIVLQGETVAPPAEMATTPASPPARRSAVALLAPGDDGAIALERQAVAAPASTAITRNPCGTSVWPIIAPPRDDGAVLFSATAR